ncbi:MAG TPA: TetR/AcrR family transcriptional regulator [Frankiaceae bacterium]|nr:TetR/AcrR family transcriptional regulator [Frankiaceae bacterium]
MTTSDRVSYHHGDLRNALLATATELAQAGGPAAVQLREAARRIGVSPSAAYRHFVDQADLLTAVATGVLNELAARMRAAMAGVHTTAFPRLDALARFRAVGLAYVDFAWTQPGLFRTAYASGVSLPDGTETAGPDPSALIGNPYGILADVLDEMADTGVLPRDRRRHAEVAAWSGVHGLSMLVLDGALRGVADDPQELVDATLEMIGIGLCAPTALGAHAPAPPGG